MGGGVSGAFRGALARLKSAPLWVWITILLTFGLLVFAYLQWKKSSSSATSGTSSAALGTVPSDGTGQPLWSTADTSGMMTGNMSDLAALLAYLQSQQTPNSPDTATPTIQPYNGTGLPSRQVNGPYQSRISPTSPGVINGRFISLGRSTAPSYPEYGV